MQRKCSACGAKNDKDAEFCIVCGQKIKVLVLGAFTSKRVHPFSIVSLFLGGLGVGILTWLSMPITNHINGLTSYGALGIFCSFQLIAIIGIIFGVVGVKKGKERVSIIGLILNIVHLLLELAPILNLIINFL
ncbi:MAG: zinc ribbon domain-containing protein [Candidatus Heimdallarchaeota archaeon]